MTMNATKLSGYFKNNRFLIVFSLFWIAGILFGFGLFLACKSFAFPMMRCAVSQQVSIVGLLCSIFLPLFCTFISHSSNKPIIILVVSFLKSASFCFSFLLATVLFGSASWLLGLLFMFSDSCILLMFFILWLWLPSCYGAKSKRIFCFSAFFGLLIAFGEYYFISPFLDQLF